MGPNCFACAGALDTRVLNEGDMSDLAPGVFQASTAADPNNCHAALLRGQLEEARLVRALRALQVRHPRARARARGMSRGYAVLLETDAPIPLTFVRGAADSINTSLEEALRRTCNFETGPVLECTVVSHDPEPTCLLILAGSHGAADGLALTIAVADLLKAYDTDSPLPQPSVTPPQTTSWFQMHQARGGRGDLALSAKDIAKAREVIAQFPTRDPGAVNQSFADHEHPDYRPVFEGVAIETLRLSKEETSRLRAAAREAGTTVTGAVGAGMHFCIVKNLLARGRVTEVVSMAVEMNARRSGKDAIASTFADELGSFVGTPLLHCPVRIRFWECAHLIRQFITAHIEARSAFTATVVENGYIGIADIMLMNGMTAAALANASNSLHVAISSLGVLDSFGEYGAFSVLENYTASHANFLALKLNLCTCSQTGCLTACVMATKNVVPDVRGLARRIRDDLFALLRHLPEVAKVPDLTCVDMHRRTSCVSATMQEMQEDAITGQFLEKLTGAQIAQEEEQEDPAVSPLDSSSEGEAEAAEAASPQGGRRLSLGAMLMEPFRRPSLTLLDEAVLQPLNAGRRLSLGGATVEQDLLKMEARMDVLMQRNRIRAATAVRSLDGRVFLGDTSGASSCWTHIQVVLCVCLTLVCTGPFVSFPIFQDQLAQSGILSFACGDEPPPCDAQNDALTGLYQSLGAVLPVLAFVPGFTFDIIGPRGQGVFMGLLSACGMAGVAAAIMVDSRAYPIMQGVLFSVSLVMAEMFGGATSLAMLGWLWHYPRSQGLIIGISNGMSQASGAMALLFGVMSRFGLDLQQDFLIMATAGALSSLALPFVIPAQKDFAREAGRVLAVDPSATVGGVCASAMTWFLRHNRQATFMVAGLYPKQSAAYLFWMTSVISTFFIFNGNMAIKNKAFFSKHEQEVLNNALGVMMGLAGVVFGPVLGFVMDFIGFRPFVVMTAAVGFIFAAVCNVPTIPGQIAAIVAICLLLSVYSVFIIRYTLLFAPPELIGSFAGVAMALTPVGSITIMVTLSALPAWATDLVMVALPALGGFFLAFVLLREGVPFKPPKNVYG